ncbi:MAG: carboxypeptidase regulatory-like domain-containing protein, partial [Bryobacteraceae bacterium]|nr:carboxypeptidase regulatory-like domain-containing protein [Bryobacteraceae bacterium]
MNARIFILAIVSAAAAFAQGDRGIIVGTVSDASGAVIPDAKVTVTHSATNVATNVTSAETGDFSAVNLPVGAYSIRVEKDGFKPAVRSGVTLPAASTIRVDFKLEIGTAQQTVEVTADVEQLMTENAKTSVNVSNKLVDELPLVVGGAMRSPFDLATLTPETKNYGDNNFSIGGGQAASYGITLDGVSAATTRALQTSWISYNAPSLEMITEFTVDSNGFKAEYGHAAGGLMSFVTKSGTNDFHGSAYEFLRNDKLDARRFFERERGVYKQHNFGLSAGGPVYIPKIINGRNKTFFFAAYEGFRNRLGSATNTASVPTEEMYAGDFSNWVNAQGTRIPIYDPATLSADRTTRQPFAGNLVPQSRFDPLAVRLINVYQSGPGGPLRPNNGAAPGTSEYVRANHIITQGTELNPWTKFDVKGDHIFNERHRLSGFFGYHRIYKNPGPQGAPNQLPGYYTAYNDSRNLSDVYRMSWDWTVRPTLLNRFYAGGNNWRESHFHPGEVIGNWQDKFCYPNVPLCNNNLSSVGFSDFTAWGGPSNNGSENTVYAFHNDLTWIKGKHTFKFGGMYQRNHYNGFGQQWDAGRVNFSFTGTGAPGNTNFAQAGGNSFASFLLGHADSGEIHTVRFIGQQWPYFAGFAQDDFRVNRRLTLNLGVRWETTLPPVEALDRWSDFSPTRANPRADGRPGALVFAGDCQGCEGTRSLAGSYYGAMGPHIGLAFSLNDKTVIRSAYSRSYGAITTVTGSTHFLGHVQIASFQNTSQGIEPTFRYRDGMPSWPVPPFIDPSFGNFNNVPWWQGSEAVTPPVNDTWTLSIQRQLPKNFMVEAAYNGLSGSKLQASILAYNS